MFENLTDVRNKSYITYKMKTICVTRLFGLLCGLTTMTDISSDEFNTDNCIKILSKICKQNLEEIPYWETIQDVFIDIKTDELRNIQKYIVKALIHSKMFNKYRFNGFFSYYLMIKLYYKCSLKSLLFREKFLNHHRFFLS